KTQILACAPRHSAKIDSCFWGSISVFMVLQMLFRSMSLEIHDHCGVSRILVRIFFHKRRRRFYAARRSEVRASEPFLLFSSPFPASTPYCEAWVGQLD